MSGRYSPPPHLSPVAAEVWAGIVKDHENPDAIIGAEFGAYCECVALERDASRRVVAEGTIVSDERGRPIAHPAIAVARQAQQDLRNWGDKFQ
ncbi:hypothetical protein CPHO_07150 [Corynebacterium phocae]|uniref:Uncharacterized protein n=1 Tax=Corynebacterium phocae TaxID=161895 RepID=A0A1L7D3Q3_9CORY|nr:P27 family phage terminase small subunit [Corynebacterium phocae]APT92703.1 hypothetical protein CPHO_07150 [Corynebacterium phocae]